MKLYITENVENAIEGYIMIPIVYGKIDLSNVPTNGAEEIVAIDALDSIPHEEMLQFFTDIRSKLRLGGTLHLSGLELQLLCHNLLNGSIDSKKFNETIFNSRSISSINEILNYLKQINLETQTAIIKGDKYEITARRTS